MSYEKTREIECQFLHLNMLMCHVIHLRYATLFYHFNIIFIVDTITDVPISLTFAHTHPAPGPHSLWPSPHWCLYLCVCIYILWLIPSPSFIQPTLHSPLWQLSFHSMCPCLCFYSVHQFVLFIRFHI